MERAKHVTEYAILTERTPEVLGKRVMEAIHQGWQPWGTVSVGPDPDGSGVVYAQPVVRYAEWV